ncbi:hypothetical protein P3342_011175 [Pyrenophora teres f. teres]|nr:hypothetical protein P3342_011175 [Pyrenophora teres f. teres]
MARMDEIKSRDLHSSNWRSWVTTHTLLLYLTRGYLTQFIYQQVWWWRPRNPSRRVRLPWWQASQSSHAYQVISSTAETFWSTRTTVHHTPPPPPAAVYNGSTNGSLISAALLVAHGVGAKDLPIAAAYR